MTTPIDVAVLLPTELPVPVSNTVVLVAEEESRVFLTKLPAAGVPKPLAPVIPMHAWPL
jgi:hypothetical protein